MSDEMSDVRAAAERLRQMRADSEAFDGGYPDNEDGRLQSLCDHAILADAYLAEHPADESLDVDEDWLVQIGFQPDASGALWIGDYRLCWFGRGFFGFDGVEVESKTRGDVRRLCRALGVEVKG